MNEHEAQELVRSIEQHWRTDFGDEGRRIWRDAIRPYDSVLAAVAVTKLAEQQSFPPRVAELREMIRGLMADERSGRPALPEAPAGRLPEWVPLWLWLRSRGDWRMLPQQQGWELAGERVEREQYPQVMEEWVAAGSPRVAMPPVGAEL